MRIRLASLAAVLLVAVAASAADPVVENVVAFQRSDGSMLVEVTYDLSDAEGDTCRVDLSASDDGGATWLYPVLTVDGDVGEGVAPGEGKTILWDVGRDHAGIWGDGYRVRVIASDQGFDWRPHSPNNYAAHDWGSPADDESLPQIAEQLARADIVSVTSSVYWDNGEREAFDIVNAIKAHNPDCTVLGYVLVQEIPLFWANQPPGTYSRIIYDAMLPFWSYTTTGDTLSSWPGTIEVNILNPDCRDLLVSVYVDYYTSSNTQFDGIFYDYFSDTIWIPAFVDCDGSADLDEDGIPQEHDPDERAAFRAAQEDLLLAMRAAMGDTFPIVCNGKRAQRDSAFASLMDGINYEIFPTMRLPDPPIGSALDPDLSYSLWYTGAWPRTEAGGPYVIIEHIQRYRVLDHEGEIFNLESGDIFRVIGLLVDGIYPAWEPSGVHDFGWPDLPLSLGEPLGPAVIDGDVYTREFTYGDVWMELKNGGQWPDPFRYRITIDGRVVQELDVPYHYP